VKRFSLRLSQAAATDILEQADWYQHQSDSALSKRWERAVTAVLLRIVNNPEIGPVWGFKHPELRNIRRVPIRDFRAT
jgi:plasmid stabilization system protein ParE